MTKYRKKPLVVDAIQLTRPKIVETLEGTMRGSTGDWLITGIKGEEYILRADIFKESYEPVGCASHSSAHPLALENLTVGSVLAYEAGFEEGVKSEQSISSAPVPKGYIITDDERKKMLKLWSVIQQHIDWQHNACHTLDLTVQEAYNLMEVVRSRPYNEQSIRQDEREKYEEQVLMAMEGYRALSTNVYLDTIYQPLVDVVKSVRKQEQP
jgi:hypothetical protein